MLFLKVTKSARGFFKKTSWLIAELLLIFLGMYGAFLLERMHDDDMDLLRKKQILQALVDEFSNYEEELGSASHGLDEGYGIPFFTAYSSGEKPFPTPIPFGGMGSVNTGIWEAMLQSGGIEVLDVEIIQEVQGFFKKLQDLLDLYSRFERLTENLILPKMDEPVDFFYESSSIELRNKYKWYVNSLFTVGMSLRELSAQAGKTKDLLFGEYQKTLSSVDGDFNEPISGKSRTIDEIEDTSEAEGTEDKIDSGNFEEELYQLLVLLSDASDRFDQNYAIPFFSSYSNRECPKPFTFQFEYLTEDAIKSLPLLIKQMEAGVYSEGKVSADVLLVHLTKIVQFLDVIKGFELKTNAQFNVEALRDLNCYDENSTELITEFEWFANELFTIGTGLREISEESFSLLENIKSAE